MSGGGSGVVPTAIENSTSLVSNNVTDHPPTLSPTVEDINAAEETHQFDADAALLLNITLICCTMLVSTMFNYTI